ncbi:MULTISPECIES: hypothetical protein [unclassified Microbacterium]|nr:hypothetical protein [Microbacterium sp.]MBN9157290.1 hypothetical protein [Microbacterium sp.]MBS1896474.1 hypothetical protein [Actinomycetota bacterium]
MTENNPTPDSTDAPVTESSEQSPAGDSTTVQSAPTETVVTGLFIAQN